MFVPSKEETLIQRELFGIDADPTDYRYHDLLGIGLLVATVQQCIIDR